MDRLLSLSQASRMVGVPRRVLQRQISDGLLSTFEGYIRTSELLKEYPEATPDNSGMVERVQRIQDAALWKDSGDLGRDPDRLLGEIHRLRIDLAEAREKVADYRELVAETSQRLLDLQDQCEKREASMLGTLVGWFMHQVKRRDPR